MWSLSPPVVLPLGGSTRSPELPWSSLGAPSELPWRGVKTVDNLYGLPGSASFWDKSPDPSKRVYKEAKRAYESDPEVVLIEEQS